MFSLYKPIIEDGKIITIFASSYLQSQKLSGIRDYFLQQIEKFNQWDLYLTGKDCRANLDSILFLW